MKPDISNLNLSVAREQLRRKEYSALELTEACLRQIARLNPTFNAFITPTLEHGRTSLHCRRMCFLTTTSSNPDELALLGIPLGLKDLVDLAGVPTTAGSKFFAESLPDDRCNSGFET